MKKFALTVMLLGLWAIKTVHAAEFFCSDVTCLIASINAANALSGEHTIFLEPGTYTLTTVDNNTDDPNGLPSITGKISIRQNDLLATIERDPNAPPFRLFHVAPSGDLSLYGLGLRNGSNEGFAPSSLGGGAIYNRGSLSLEQLAIYQNGSFGSSNFGGAIRNDGRAVLVDTELTDNISDFFQASGGAAIGNRGELTITRGLIRGNGALCGGGIVSGGELTMTDSAVVENSSGSSVGGCIGGGLVLSGVATIINTTIARNVAGNAGGITTSGFLRIINSVVAQNNSASVNPSSGGIQNRGGTVEIVNTIVAGNVTGFTGDAFDCEGLITSLGNNIIGTVAGCTIDLQATDFVGDPGLDDFADTHYPLLPDSPAINSANPDACPETDQLGNPRVGICDIGSIEFQGQGPLLIVRRDMIRAGRSIVVRWRGIPAPTSTDWIGLYLPGSPNTAFIDWIYVSCSKTPGNPDRRGSCDFPIPDSLAPGTYELRLLANNGFMRLASSDGFMVTAKSR